MNKSIIAVDISSEDRSANPDKLTPASARNSALSVPFRECADARATHDRRLALDSAKATYASRTSVAPAERPCNCEAEENPVRTRGASRRPARFTSGSRELRRDSVAVHFHRYPTPPSRTDHCVIDQPVNRVSRQHAAAAAFRKRGELRA